MFDMQAQLNRNAIAIMNGQAAKLKAELADWTSEIRQGYAKPNREYDYAVRVLRDYDSRGRCFDARSITDELDTALEVCREERLERMNKLTAFLRG